MPAASNCTANEVLRDSQWRFLCHADPVQELVSQVICTSYLRQRRSCEHVRRQRHLKSLTDISVWQQARAAVWSIVSQKLPETPGAALWDAQLFRHCRTSPAHFVSMLQARARCEALQVLDQEITSKRLFGIPKSSTHAYMHRNSPCCRRMENVSPSSSEDDSASTGFCASKSLPSASAVPPMSRKTEMGPAQGDGAPSPPMLPSPSA